MIRIIEGVKHVLAHSYEKGAIEHDGEHWRIADPYPLCEGLLTTQGELNGYAAYCLTCSSGVDLPS